MMIELSKNGILASIHLKGAELCSLLDTRTGTEYIWKGDPAFWGKHSPVLFPIVGALKENTFTYSGKAYRMGRHGFARDRDFEIESNNSASASMVLKSNEETRRSYPFDFLFRIRYSLLDDGLYVAYEVENQSEELLYFSVGGHPAFAVPLEPHLSYSDYFLAFNKSESAGRWPISAEGLIEENPIPFFSGEDRIPLRPELFYKDALVFKQLNSDHIRLGSEKGRRGLEFSFPGFPYFGIWAAKDAGFVCLEPWCGIADSVLSDQELKNKEGIMTVSPGARWKRQWSVRIF